MYKCIVMRVVFDVFSIYTPKFFVKKLACGKLLCKLWVKVVRSGELWGKIS